MFTGIVEEVGRVKSINSGTASAVLVVEAFGILDDIHLGDSIAVNGVCLTATDFSKNSFSADVMHETLERSSLGSLIPGSHVNLERAMKADGRFGGHIVSGHIDGTGVVLDIKRDDNAIWYTIGAGKNILRYVVEKGSIAIDGISLTVAGLHKDSFSVSVIPHTASNTILSLRKRGERVNLENDIIGKYVERFMATACGGSRESNSSITEEFLLENGF